MKPHFYTRKEVLAITRFSRSTIDRYEAKGKFPKRLTPSPNRVFWIASQVDKWCEELIGELCNAY